MKNNVMAIVTCKSCGRLLYRPDEMTGTAWQCIGCGPTEIARDPVEVPVQLAQLLEDEYKRVVWGTIYRGSDAMTRMPQTPSERSRIPAELSCGLQGISEKRLDTGGRFYDKMVNRLLILWVLAYGILLILALFLGTLLAVAIPYAILAIIGLAQFAVLVVANISWRHSTPASTARMARDTRARAGSYSQHRAEANR